MQWYARWRVKLFAEESLKVIGSHRSVLRIKVINRVHRKMQSSQDLKRCETPAFLFVKSKLDFEGFDLARIAGLHHPPNQSMYALQSRLNGDQLNIHLSQAGTVLSRCRAMRLSTQSPLHEWRTSNAIGLRRTKTSKRGYTEINLSLHDVGATSAVTS